LIGGSLLHAYTRAEHRLDHNAILSYLYSAVSRVFRRRESYAIALFYGENSPRMSGESARKIRGSRREEQLDSRLKR